MKRSVLAGLFFVLIILLSSSFAAAQAAIPTTIPSQGAAAPAAFPADIPKLARGAAQSGIPAPLPLPTKNFDVTGLCSLGTAGMIDCSFKKFNRFSVSSNVKVYAKVITGEADSLGEVDEIILTGKPGDEVIITHHDPEGDVIFEGFIDDQGRLVNPLPDEVIGVGEVEIEKGDIDVVLDPEEKDVIEGRQDPEETQELSLGVKRVSWFRDGKADLINQLEEKQKEEGVKDSDSDEEPGKLDTVFDFFKQFKFW